MSPTSCQTAPPRIRSGIMVTAGIYCNPEPPERRAKRVQFPSPSRGGQGWGWLSSQIAGRETSSPLHEPGAEGGSSSQGLVGTETHPHPCPSGHTQRVRRSDGCEPVARKPSVLTPLKGREIRDAASPRQIPNARWHQAITGLQAKPSTSSEIALIENTTCSGLPGRTRTSPSGSSKYITFITRR